MAKSALLALVGHMETAAFAQLRPARHGRECLRPSTDGATPMHRTLWFPSHFWTGIPLGRFPDGKSSFPGKTMRK